MHDGHDSKLGGLPDHSEGLARVPPAQPWTRLLSIWQIGKGDYNQDRDRLFTGDSVNSLFEEAAKYPSK